MVLVNLRQDALRRVRRYGTQARSTTQGVDAAQRGLASIRERISRLRGADKPVHTVADYETDLPDVGHNDRQTSRKSFEECDWHALVAGREDEEVSDTQPSRNSLGRQRAEQCDLGRETKTLDLRRDL